MLNDAFNSKVIDWAKFLPHQLSYLKSSLIPLKKKEIRESLENAFHHSQNDADYVKQEFIECFAGESRSEILPDYHVESYKACFLSERGPKDVIIEYQIYNNNCLYVRPTIDRKDNWQAICSIQELCFITFKKSRVEIEISRRNGIPHYFTFNSERELKSFVSLLDGYYRLSEKWSFSLCSDISSPHLNRLKNNKCHGPISDEFAHKKLREKAEKVGTYLLREHRTFYDELIFDVLVNEQNRIKTYRVENTRPGEYMLDKTNKIYRSLSELLHQFYLQESNAGEIRLGTCKFAKRRKTFAYHTGCILVDSICVVAGLPPSEFDLSENLLLCRTVNHASKAESASNLTDWPQVIPYKSLIFDINGNAMRPNLANGRFRVRKAILRREKDSEIVKESVIVKEVVNDEDAEYFLKTMNQWMHAKSECIVNFVGITLHAPLALVMEDLPFGPLDAFLKQHQRCLKVVDLIVGANAFDYLRLFICVCLCMLRVACVH